MNIDELAAAGGVNRRTVRYYIQRGLLAAPFGVGRGKHYGPEHLRRLIEVRTLQENGASLDQIRSHYPVLMRRSESRPRISASANYRAVNEASADPRALADPHVLAPPLANAQAWLHLAIAEGVELHVQLDRLSELNIDVVIFLAKTQLTTMVNTTSTPSSNCNP